MKLTPEAVEKLQKTLDTPVDGEDALWAKIASDVQADDEPAIRSGLRLLKSVSGNGSLTAVLKEAGLVVADAVKPPADKLVDKSVDKAQKTEIPDAFAEVMKSAGFEQFAEVLKSMDANPQVTAVVMPVMAAMAAQVKQLSTAVEKSADERRIERVTKKAGDLGFANDEAMVGLLKGMTDEQLEAFGTAMAPATARIKAAEKQLLTEKGTSARDEAGGDAYAEITKAAKELVTKGESKDLDEAMRAVMNSDPALYERYRVESAGKGA